jgi:hypothetical protein
MQTYNSFGELKDGFMLPKKAFHAGNDLLINPSIVIISSISQVQEESRYILFGKDCDTSGISPCLNGVHLDAGN